MVACRNFYLLTTACSGSQQWDLYGTFCFVPTEEDAIIAISMLHGLRTSNENWRENQAAFS